MTETDKHPLTLWLEAVGKTPSEFARELGKSRGYITHITKGRRCPRQLLQQIAERTGIPYERLRRAA